MNRALEIYILADGVILRVYAGHFTTERPGDPGSACRFDCVGANVPDGVEAVCEEHGGVELVML